jgi:dTDP-4-amino-4,6-dideoxygalactose transaminase
MIRVSKSTITDLDKQAVLKVLDKEFLGMGSEVLNFEKKLEYFFGRDVACVVNGTAAIQLAIQSCGIKSGDEIIVPSLSYVACFQAITANNAIPVPCDINLNTLNIDIEDLKKKITKKTKIIIILHYGGSVAQVEDIYKISKKYKIRIIEDAAHAFGTVYKKKKIGSFGDIICFSFDGIKNITSGEGGCVVSSDKKIIERIKNYRLLGIVKESAYRYKNKRNWNYQVDNQGWRYHMSNIMAAIGNEQLKRFKLISNKRKSLAYRYFLLLRNNPYIKIIQKDFKNVVPHIFVIKLDQLINRKKIQLYLKNYNIETGVHWKPNHMLNFFKSKNCRLVNTEEVFDKILTLPLHLDLKISDVDYICKCLIKSISLFHEKKG